MELGLLTDHFGDIPYDEAFTGADNLKPAFETQEDIYTTIFTLLADGKTDLAAPSSVSPGGDDLIHGGDLAAWMATADALIARNLNHLSKTSQYDGAAVIAACDDALTAGAYATIGCESALNQNPWYQFTVIDRAGYVLNMVMYDSLMLPSSDQESISTELPIVLNYGIWLCYFCVASCAPFELYFIKAEAQWSLTMLQVLERLWKMRLSLT